MISLTVIAVDKTFVHNRFLLSLQWIFYFYFFILFLLFLSPFSQGLWHRLVSLTSRDLLAMGFSKKYTQYTNFLYVWKKGNWKLFCFVHFCEENEREINFTGFFTNFVEQIRFIYYDSVFFLKIYSNTIVYGNLGI